MNKLLLLAMVVFSATASAQQDVTNAPVPQIAVASHGEVKVVSDRATIQISVQTQAPTAASAGTENARKQKAVIDALTALGIDPKDISTSGYNVNPEQRYEPNKPPVLVGYNVTNTVLVEIRKLSMVGPAIDVALAKGANMVNSLQFYASNTDAARREAIAIAVRNAKADADAAARAAGGTISELLEIQVGGPISPPRPFYPEVAMAKASGADTPIAAGDQTVTVNINTRWRFNK